QLVAIHISVQRERRTRDQRAVWLDLAESAGRTPDCGPPLCRCGGAAPGCRVRVSCALGGAASCTADSGGRMKITDMEIITFRTRADRFQHGVRYPSTELLQTITCIQTDAGVTGYYIGGGSHGDQDGLKPDDREMLLGRIRSLIVGQDPL